MTDASMFWALVAFFFFAVCCSADKNSILGIFGRYVRDKILEFMVGCLAPLIVILWNVIVFVSKQLGQLLRPARDEVQANLASVLVALWNVIVFFSKQLGQLLIPACDEVQVNLEVVALSDEAEPTKDTEPLTESPEEHDNLVGDYSQPQPRTHLTLNQNPKLRPVISCPSKHPDDYADRYVAKHRKPARNQFLDAARENAKKETPDVESLPPPTLPIVQSPVITVLPETISILPMSSPEHAQIEAPVPEAEIVENAMNAEGVESATKAITEAGLDDLLKEIAELKAQVKQKELDLKKTTEDHEQAITQATERNRILENRVMEAANQDIDLATQVNEATKPDPSLEAQASQVTEQEPSPENQLIVHSTRSEHTPVRKNKALLVKKLQRQHRQERSTALNYSKNFKKLQRRNAELAQAAREIEQTGAAEETEQAEAAGETEQAEALRETERADTAEETEEALKRQFDARLAERIDEFRDAMQTVMEVLQSSNSLEAKHLVSLIEGSSHQVLRQFRGEFRQQAIVQLQGMLEAANEKLGKAGDLEVAKTNFFESAHRVKIILTSFLNETGAGLPNAHATELNQVLDDYPERALQKMCEIFVERMQNVKKLEEEERGNKASRSETKANNVSTFNFGQQVAQASSNLANEGNDKILKEVQQTINNFFIDLNAPLKSLNEDFKIKHLHYLERYLQQGKIDFWQPTLATVCTDVVSCIMRHDVSSKHELDVPVGNAPNDLKPATQDSCKRFREALKTITMSFTKLNSDYASELLEKLESNQLDVQQEALTELCKMTKTYYKDAYHLKKVKRSIATFMTDTPIAHRVLNLVNFQTAPEPADSLKALKELLRNILQQTPEAAYGEFNTDYATSTSDQPQIEDFLRQPLSPPASGVGESHDYGYQDSLSTEPWPGQPGYRSSGRQRPQQEYDDGEVEEMPAGEALQFFQESQRQLGVPRSRFRQSAQRGSLVQTTMFGQVVQSTDVTSSSIESSEAAAWARIKAVQEASKLDSRSAAADAARKELEEKLEQERQRVGRDRVAPSEIPSVDTSSRPRTRIQLEIDDLDPDDPDYEIMKLQLEQGG